MADSYRRYGAVPADRASAESALTTSQPWNSNGSRATSDLLPRDILPLGHGSYGGDGLANIRPGSAVDGLLGPAPGLQRYPSPIQDRSLLSQRHNGIYPGSSVDGLATSAGIQRYPSPIQDRSLLSQRHDAAPGRSPRISDIPQMQSSFTRPDGPLATEGESNVLFVDCLPTDCSRREVGHLFRPFIGFKDIKVVHKEARRKGDKATVLCFVEFADAKCALTALESLQGYNFDDKKPESPALQISFAHFPFRLPSHNEHKVSGPIQ